MSRCTPGFGTAVAVITTLPADAGTVYGLVAERAPIVRAGFGSHYGSLVWAVADEKVVPALGLSQGLRELSPSVHGYSFIGHWINRPRSKPPYAPDTGTGSSRRATPASPSRNRRDSPGA